jgi:peptidoglycan/LPS O-acetylase OafA/YrhL
MNRETSVYLDAVRFLAALMVFFSHVGERFFSGGFLWRAVPFGAPAVIVFFVLSGFVISYVAGRRETSAREYVIARAARLYSVVVPTLLLTAVLDWLGSRIDPGGYLDVRQMLGLGAWDLPADLTFLHMSWLGSARGFAGSNGAYWTLGYEVIYYVLFGFAFFGRGIVRMVGCLVVAGVAGPAILGLFPMWLLGWAAFHVCDRGILNRRGGWIVFTGSSVGLAIYFAVTDDPIGILAFDATELALGYLVAILFTFNVIGFHAVSGAFRSPVAWVGGPIRWLAGATFTLYLLHHPLLYFIRFCAPWPLASWQYRVTAICAPLIAIFVVAHFTERKKEIWRRGFAGLADFVSAAAQRVSGSA